MRMNQFLAVVFFFILLSMPISLGISELDKIYFLELKFESPESISLIKTSLDIGYPSVFDDPDLLYVAQVWSYDEELLFTGNFNIPLEIFLAPPLNGNATGDTKSFDDLGSVEFSLSIPYFEKGSHITLSQSKQLLLDVDVSGFGIYCGDAVCQPKENFTSCSQDCVDVTSLVGQQTQDFVRNKQFQSETSETSSSKILSLSNKSPLVSLGLVISLIIIFFVSFLYYKRKDAPSSDFSYQISKKTLAQKYNISFRDLNQLLSYVRSNSNKGQSISDIRAELIKSGWDKELVDDIVSMFNIHP